MYRLKQQKTEEASWYTSSVPSIMLMNLLPANAPEQEEEELEGEGERPPSRYSSSSLERITQRESLEREWQRE